MSRQDNSPKQQLMQVRDSPRGPPQEGECKPGGDIGRKHAEVHRTGGGSR